MEADRLLRGLKKSAKFAARVAGAVSEQQGAPDRAGTGGKGVAAAGPSDRCLFDGEGKWTAYRDGDYLYDAATNAPIGFSPHGDGEFADLDGDYLCSIVGSRLWRAYGAPFANCGRASLRTPGFPPPPISTVHAPMNPPAGYGPFPAG
jgi:hypothetical protein